MSRPHHMPQPLYKQHSWSPNADCDEVWLRHKGNYSIGLSCSKRVKEEDLEELKGCIELGFGFGLDSSDLDPKLLDALPVLGFYYAVNKWFSKRLSRPSLCSSMVSISASGNPSSIFDQGDDPEMVKKRSRQWSQVVASSVRQFSGEPK